MRNAYLALLAIAVVAVACVAPMMATALHRGSSVAADGHLTVVSSGGPCGPFPDVNRSDQHCANISWLMAAGVTMPSDGIYRSAGTVTRGSMTAFLFRQTHPNQPSPKCTKRPFPDVALTDVFCGYIQWAETNHIAFGYPDGTFGPSKPVTRGAMAAFLKRIATDGSATPRCIKAPFADVPVADTFCGVITWMRDEQITFGVGDGTNYGTTLPVTRGAMASFLRRIAERPGVVGNTFVLTIDGRRAASAAVTAMSVVRPPNALAPTQQYLSVRVVLRGFAGLAETASGSLQLDPAQWTLRVNGKTYRPISSGGAEGSLKRSVLRSGTSLIATVVFDAPLHGTVRFDVPGYDAVSWRS